MKCQKTSTQGTFQNPMLLRASGYSTSSKNPKDWAEHQTSLQLRSQLEGKLATLSKVQGPNLPEALEVHSGPGEGSGQVRGRGHGAKLPRPQPAQGSSLTVPGLPRPLSPFLAHSPQALTSWISVPLSPPHLLGSVGLSAARKQLQPSVCSLPPTWNTNWCSRMM